MGEPMRPLTANERITEAIDIVERYGTIDGAHHKQWVLDQIVRVLLGADYDEWVQEQAADDYPWDEGIAP